MTLQAHHSKVTLMQAAIHFEAFSSLFCDLFFFIFPQRKILGSDFFNKVCGHLKLLEKEYFGLEFRHHTGSYVSQNL